MEEQGRGEGSVIEVVLQLDHKAVTEEEAHGEEEECLPSICEASGTAEILHQFPEAQPDLAVTGNLAHCPGTS